MKTLKSNLKSQRAITLVALVVTIVVLLILAGVTLNLVIGDNGIISKAKDAKNATSQGLTNDQIGMNSLYDELIGLETGASGGGTSGGNGGEEIIPEGTYSIAGVTPSPEDLFYYEPISTTTGKLASTELTGLPEKKARITGMNEKYCNSVWGRDTYTYIDENKNKVTVPDTNYEIIYNGTKISDTLVIPYKVKIGDEYYTVTEVELRVHADNSGEKRYQYPIVNTIIYPNTVDTIKLEDGDLDLTKRASGAYIKNVILPNSLKTLGKGSLRFSSEGYKTTVWLPKSVTSIDENACKKINSVTGPRINYEGTEEEWNSLSSGINFYRGVAVKFNCTMPTAIPQILDEETLDSNYSDYVIQD